MRTATFDTTIQWMIPVIIAMLFILLCSLIKEPARKKFMAIFAAGAGGAYLSGGGFGLWEMALCGAMAVECTVKKKRRRQERTSVQWRQLPSGLACG